MLGREHGYEQLEEAVEHALELGCFDVECCAIACSEYDPILESKGQLSRWR